jgi:hypothetical protein
LLSTRPLKNKTSVSSAASARTRYTEFGRGRGKQGTEMKCEWLPGEANTALPIGALANRPQAG